MTYYALNDWVERVVAVPAKPGQRRANERASEKPPCRSVSQSCFQSKVVTYGSVFLVKYANVAVCEWERKRVGQRSAETQQLSLSQATSLDFRPRTVLGSRLQSAYSRMA